MIFQSEASAQDQPFLGSGLVSLLSIVATVSSEDDLLQEIDRFGPHYTLLKFTSYTT